MYFGFYDVEVDDLEENAWMGFDEPEKLKKLVEYGYLYENRIKQLSRDYRNCLGKYLNNNNHIFDIPLINSFPEGILKTPEIRQYLEKAIIYSSESDREKFFSNSMLSSEIKDHLKDLLDAGLAESHPDSAIGDREDESNADTHCVVRDTDFEKENWGRFNHREQRCKLLIQGKNLQLMLDNYKRHLLEYMEKNTNCNELLDTLPEKMYALQEFKDKLKRVIDRASDYERILLLYKLVNLKYGEQRYSQLGDYDLIALFDPSDHEGETIEFWPVYLFLKCGLETDAERKKGYFMQAHYSFKNVGEAALKTWRGQEERPMEALGLLFPCCNELGDESFQRFCDARLWVTEDDVKFRCGTLDKTRHVYCYGCRGKRKVLGLDTWEKVFDGYNRHWERKYKDEKIKGCAHVRSLLHDRFYLKNYSIPPGKWTLFEFMDILKIPFYEIPGYTGKNRELYVNKLASEFNWLYRIKDRLQCRSCHEQMRFDFEYSKKGENVPDNSDLSGKSLFAAYMTTRGHCTHQEEPHDIDVYLNHCIDCHGIIDSRYCTIFDGKHYLCRRCGSGHPANTVPGTICPYCGSNRMVFSGYRTFKCLNCSHKIKVEYNSFKKYYLNIQEGDLASSCAYSTGSFTYRKNCKDVGVINCDIGISLREIVADPIEERKLKNLSFDD